jgi:uncharacterized protein (TIGR02145 family)
MMKTKKLAWIVMLSLNLCGLNSCVNAIQDENPQEGDVPINLSTGIQSRVANNAFEEKDVIGVFMLSGSQSLSSERYLDNIAYNSKTALPTSGETLYYPTGNAKCTFISYYPYKENILKAGEDKINVTVATDQSNDANYAQSDFLVAVAGDVVPSSKAVELQHQHRLALIDIVLQPSEGATAEQLLASKPEVSVVNVSSECKYNMLTEEITELGAKQSLVPHGEWKVSEGKLVGKSAIVIPQTITTGTALFNVTVEGKSYVCRLDKDFEVKAKSKNTLTVPCSKWAVGSLSFTIADWNAGNDATTSLETEEGCITLSSLPFGTSKVCNVYHEGTLVTQICREYLNAANIDATAVVAYPVTGGKADLTKGIVLQLNGTKNANGGSVAWDVATNKLTYTPGTQADVQCVYVGEDHRISFTKPETNYSLSVAPFVLNDKRGSEIKSYPVVKIAAQYWMGSELQTTKYTDGTDIVQKDEMSQTYLSPCCALRNGNVFYNYSAVDNAKLIPDGWRVPKQKEFDALFAYAVDIAKLKDVSLKTAESDATNVTGFTALPRGVMGYSNKFVFVAWKTDVCLWYCSDAGVADGRYRISSEIKDAEDVKLHVQTDDNYYGYKAYSVRCIMK